MKPSPSRSGRPWWLAPVALVAIVVAAVAAYAVLRSGLRTGGGQPDRDPEVLRQAVVSMRDGCSSLSTTFFQGTTDQSEYWSVRCASGREYQVDFRSNGSTNVLDCDVLARLATRPCFTLLESER